MKRPTGVFFAAIVLLLISLLQVFAAFSMALAGIVLPMEAHAGVPTAAPIPDWMPIFMYALCAFFLALAAWGITTTVGLFRLRPWARYSILVIGSGLALIGLVSALATGLLVLVPMPLPSTVDASQVQSTQAMTKVIFAVVAFLYAILCAVGVSWLIYFNRKKVREVFTPESRQLPAPGSDSDLIARQGPPALGNPNPQRPFLISLLAVLNMIGAAFCILSAFLPFPALIFGFFVEGWHKAAIYILFGAIQAAIGVGLWRLKEWGRLLALGMIVVGVAQCIVFIVRPTQIVKYSQEFSHKMVPMQPQMPEQFQTMLFRGSTILSVLLCIAIAAVLVYYRRAFVEARRTETL